MTTGDSSATELCGTALMWLLAAGAWGCSSERPSFGETGRINSSAADSSANRASGSKDSGGGRPRRSLDAGSSRSSEGPSHADSSCESQNCKALAGAACEENEDCQSEFCIDGVCCTEACTGECQTCAAEGSEGKCVVATGDPPANRAACDGDGACQGSCDGKSPDCVFPGEEVLCRDASCSTNSGTATGKSYCDGSGACPDSEITGCDGYACDGTECRADCRHDGDCRDGASCVEATSCIAFEEKRLHVTTGLYQPSGVAGADQACQGEFGGLGGTWKALIVGGGRIASIMPFAGDGQNDWVIKPYTRYYNQDGRHFWTTTEVALLGVLNGARAALEDVAWSNSSAYPWAGYNDDWTTSTEHNCDGWSNASQDGGNFAYNSLLSTGDAIERCITDMRYACVEQ